MKNNQKCVRMSDEVLEYVNRFPGDGFNAKFENLVLHFKDTEPELKKNIAQLDREIKTKQDKLRSYGERIYKADRIRGFLDAMSEDIASLPQRAKKIIEE